MLQYLDIIQRETFKTFNFVLMFHLMFVKPFLNH